MGHLYLNLDSFELEHVPRSERDEIFASFCKAMDCAQKQNDTIYGTDEVYSREFSYGTLIFDFLYNGWETIDANPHLNGISNTTHDLYISLLFSIPSLVEPIESKADFLQQHEGHHFGYMGFSIATPPVPYVCSFKTYNIWKCPWLSKHQGDILWRRNDDPYLPNVEYSNIILLEEIEKHGKKDCLAKYRGNIALTFHEEVMRHKGADIGTYGREIGGRVLIGNYYELDEDLTRDERRANNNRRRSIYKLLSRDERLNYISIDHGHGMFEYHDFRGDHLGENRFDGGYNSGPEPDHSLKTL